MSLHRLPAAHGLLARKGGAAPLGLRKPSPEPAAPDPDDAQPNDPSQAESGEGAAAGLAETRAPVQLALVSGAGAQDGGAQTGGAPEAGAIQSEPPPPASMLPFALHRTRRELGEPWELVSPGLLDEMAEAATHPDAPVPAEDAPESPRPEAAAAGPSPETGIDIDAIPPDAAPPESAPPESASPEPTLQEPTLPEPTLPEPALPEPPPVAAETVAAPPPTAAATATAAADPAANPAASPALAAPTADPAWRVGLDTLPAARRTSQQPWLWALAAACLAIAGIAWWSFESRAPAPGAPASVAGTDSGSESAAPVSTPSSISLEPLTAQPAEAVPAEAAPAEAGPAEQAPAGDTQALDQPAAEIAPKVDLVRIEPNGDAVIAGRAAPESELIILDNGAPIGTVKADVFGEWVFVPEAPLPDGGHAFSLVLKAEQGRVTVPAKPKPEPGAAAPAAEGDAGADAQPDAGTDAGTDAGPGAAAGAENPPVSVPLPVRKPLDDARDGALKVNGALKAPIPARKPSPAADQSLAPPPPGADFVVQLASVKTRAGARREWEKLRLRFPEVLAGMDLSLHEAKLAQRGTVIRVRTGPFSELGEAADFCARIRAGRRDCLVVRANAPG